MTKQELHSIRSLRDEIKFWERALKRIRNKSPVGSPQFDAVPCNSGISNRVQDRVENTRSIEEIIAEKKAELEAKERELTEYIMTVDDSLVRRAMYLRHVCCKSWNAVAMDIGGDNTADTIRMAHDRFVKRNL